MYDQQKYINLDLYLSTQESLVPLGAGFWVMIESQELTGILVGYKELYDTDDSKILWDASIVELKTTLYIYQDLCFRIQIVRDLPLIKVIEFKLEVV